MKIKEIEKKAAEAIRSLRESYHRKGLPFMINSSTLPSDQCYFEYPNGSIVLVSLSRKENDFKIVTRLSQKEGMMIMKKHKLI